MALDDAVALVAFSVCTAVTQALKGRREVNAMDVAAPVSPLESGAVVLGIGLGWVLHRLISERSSDHRLVIANGVIFGDDGTLHAAEYISPAHLYGLGGFLH